VLSWQKKRVTLLLWFSLREKELATWKKETSKQKRANILIFGSCVSSQSFSSLYVVALFRLKIIIKEKSHRGAKKEKKKPYQKNRKEKKKKKLSACIL
jgi:hypothetical protein